MYKKDLAQVTAVLKAKQHERQVAQLELGM